MWQTGDKRNINTSRNSRGCLAATYGYRYRPRYLNNTNNDSTLKTNAASQTSSPEGTQPQHHVVATEQPSGNQTGNEPVPFRDCSKISSINTQNTEQHVVTTLKGDTTTPPLTTATPLIEEGLMRDGQTNELYLPLTSTVVLKRKQ